MFIVGPPWGDLGYGFLITSLSTSLSFHTLEHISSHISAPGKALGLLFACWSYDALIGRCERMGLFAKRCLREAGKRQWREAINNISNVSTNDHTTSCVRWANASSHKYTLPLAFHCRCHCRADRCWGYDALIGRRWGYEAMIGRG